MNHDCFYTSLALIILSVAGNHVLAQPAPHIEPTEEQLQAAIRTFEKLGGRLEKRSDYLTKQLTFVAFMPRPTKNDDLKKIPLMPFSFGLDLTGTDTLVTDEGFRNLTELRTLSALWLHSTKVTDSGLREVAKINGLSFLDLGFTKVTDAGMKEVANLHDMSSLCLIGTGAISPHREFSGKMKHHQGDLVD